MVNHLGPIDEAEFGERQDAVAVERGLESEVEAVYYQSAANYLLNRLRRSWHITRKSAIAQPITSNWFPLNRPPFGNCDDC